MLIILNELHVDLSNESVEYSLHYRWGIRSGLENILKVGDILSEEKTIHVQWNQCKYNS